MKAEVKRIHRQSSLDGERSQEERNKLGQFATPPELAREIVKIGLGYLGDGPIDFFEPSIGSGAFYSALLQAAGKRIASARGAEIDPRFVATARELWGKTGLDVALGDFTRMKPHATRRANLVLANPPYVRHHHLDRDDKIVLKQRAEALLGCKVSGLAGLYVHFLLLGHAWMRDSAVAAWLIPTEWMDVNYGSALKEYLCTKVRLLRVHCFDASDVQFGDALVSSAVVFFVKKQPESGDVCCLTRGSLAAPSRTVELPVRVLRGDPKWRRHFAVGSPARPKATVTLGDLFDVKRGLATGGNEYFIRPREQFLAMGIPTRFLKPVLPSSKHIEGEVIERAADGYPDMDKPLALLDCNLPEDALRRSFPKLCAYLESDAGKAAKKGYLTSGRRPWYSQEQRPYAPVITTYMGRGRKGATPFRFFWNKSDATATNVYLMLIPKPAVAEVFRRDAGAGGAVVQFLRETDLEELLGHGRVYGGGLYKLEPKELGRLDAGRLAAQLL